MFNHFINLCIFSLFVISIINRLTLDDGDFVCCHVISEMQHALETRLPFYKWKHKYLLNLHDCMAMVKAIPLKVSMTCSCFGCVVDNLVPRALNFFHLSLKKKCLGYLTLLPLLFVGVIFVFDLIRKLIPIKWRACN